MELNSLQDIMAPFDLSDTSYIGGSCFHKNRGSCWYFRNGKRVQLLIKLNDSILTIEPTGLITSGRSWDLTDPNTDLKQIKRYIHKTIYE